MDLSRAFSYVLDDEQWLTVILIGGLLLLVPILGPIMLTGFLLEAARNVAMGSSRPLPRWDNFGDKFSLGISGIVIQIVYSLPAALIAILFACLAAGLSVGAGENEGAIAGIMIALWVCLMPIMLLLTAVIQPLTLAAWTRYLQTGSLGAALRVGDLLALFRANLGVWLILWLLQILCGFVGGLGVIALGIGALFTTVYAQAVFGHLLGQNLAQLGRPAGYDPVVPGPIM